MLPMLYYMISMNLIHSSFKWSDVRSWSSFPNTDNLAMKSPEDNII